MLMIPLLKRIAVPSSGTNSRRSELCQRHRTSTSCLPPKTALRFRKTICTSLLCQCPREYQFTNIYEPRTLAAALEQHPTPREAKNAVRFGQAVSANEDG